MYVSYNILIYINQITSTYFLILVQSSVSITARITTRIWNSFFGPFVFPFNQQVAS